MPPKKRNRASAKKAGATFERLISNYLAKTIDDRIDRKVRTGAKDTGDIANLRTTNGQRITVECKNTTRTNLAGWWNEATTERDNAGDDLAIIIHKRHGVGDPAQQWATLTVEELTKLIHTH